MYQRSRMAFFDALNLIPSAGESPVPPMTFLLIPFGLVRFTKGNGSGEFSFTEPDARVVISEFTLRGRDLVIDYEHQSLSGDKAPAAGWIDRLSIAPEGLFAHVKYWTDEACNLLKNREYRYFSPTLCFSRSGKNISAIHSVALTNHPAMHNIPALAADDRAADVEPTVPGISIPPQPTKENRMNELLKQAGLTSFADQSEELQIQMLTEKICEWRTTCDALTTFLNAHQFFDLDDAERKISDMVPKATADQLANELSAQSAEKLVDTAFHEGKLAESMRPWAIAFAQNDPGAFTSWTQQAPRLIPSNDGIADATPENHVEATDSQKEIFRLLNLKPETIQLLNHKEN